MNFETQILFLFSALGAFNGFVLSIFFAFFSKLKHPSNYFLGALLFVVSIRIIKSVFLYFNSNLSGVFVQIGISACVLIGPLLYLYIHTMIKERGTKKWGYHIIPFLLVIGVLGIIYPYWPNRTLWSKYLIKGIYFQWLLYIILSGILLKDVLKGILTKERKTKEENIWMVSIFLGVFIIWIAYNTTSYTSYIAGALSFSFVFYLLILLWFFKKKKETSFLGRQVKYANKKIDESEAEVIKRKLEETIRDKKMFKNPNLKLIDLANEIDIVPHQLSQFLNDNLGKSFSLFINEYRIQEAKRLLVEETKYTTEAIGYECGFNSKSTFFTTFKKIVGTTPATYKK
ncbi:helix-turn-helix domain-containing protein [Aquimarina sp. I32.4]|uniref:helix-turn-helix domain-containing protein n=1 Tax=Aquimarina sp. I32.4 TaxID=2053903 RepID=UPI000CDF1699|nr:helix-turn-helix domain-containing protein [Aquimarina sp. I32.4]